MGWSSRTQGFCSNLPSLDGPSLFPNREIWSFAGVELCRRDSGLLDWSWEWFTFLIRSLMLNSFEDFDFEDIKEERATCFPAYLHFMNDYSRILLGSTVIAIVPHLMNFLALFHKWKVIFQRQTMKRKRILGDRLLNHLRGTSNGESLVIKWNGPRVLLSDARHVLFWNPVFFEVKFIQFFWFFRHYMLNQGFYSYIYILIFVLFLLPT